MKEEISRLLEEYGLDKKEIKVYIVLVEKGELNAYALAKITGIHRSTTYAVIDRLILKGLISQIEKEGKIFYSSLDINQIITKVKEKEALLLSLIPKFENIQKGNVSKVRVFENKESQKQFNFNLFNNIKNGVVKELYIISGGPSETINNKKKDPEDLGSKIFLENLLNELKKRKSSKKVDYKGIWNDKFKGTGILNLFEDLGENKFLKDIPTLATTVIFGDSIAYLFTMNNIPQVIEIQNKLITEENKAYFNYLWKIAKK